MIFRASSGTICNQFALVRLHPTQPLVILVLNLPCTFSVKLKMSSRRRLTDRYILQAHQRILGLPGRVEFLSGISALLINLSSQGNYLHEGYPLLNVEYLKCKTFLIYRSGALKFKSGLGRTPRNTSFQFAMSKLKSTFCQPSEVVVVQMYIFFSKPKSTFCQHSEVVAVHSIHKDKDHHKQDRTNRTRTITKSSPRIKLFYFPSF